MDHGVDSILKFQLVWFRRAGYSVHLVGLVYLVDLVRLVSFVQPKNQTDQTNQIPVFVRWRTFSASCQVSGERETKGTKHS